MVFVAKSCATLFSQLALLVLLSLYASLIDIIFLKRIHLVSRGFRPSGARQIAKKLRCKKLHRPQTLSSSYHFLRPITLSNKLCSLSSHAHCGLLFVNTLNDTETQYSGAVLAHGILSLFFFFYDFFGDASAPTSRLCFRISS